MKNFDAVSMKAAIGAIYEHVTAPSNPLSEYIHKFSGGDVPALGELGKVAASKLNRYSSSGADFSKANNVIIGAEECVQTVSRSARGKNSTIKIVVQRSFEWGQAAVLSGGVRTVSGYVPTDKYFMRIFFTDHDLSSKHLFDKHLCDASIGFSRTPVTMKSSDDPWEFFTKKLPDTIDIRVVHTEWEKRVKDFQDIQKSIAKYQQFM